MKTINDAATLEAHLYLAKDAGLTGKAVWVKRLLKEADRFMDSEQRDRVVSKYYPELVEG